MDHQHEVPKLLDNLQAGIETVRNQIASPQAGIEAVRNQIASQPQIVYQEQIVYLQLIGLQIRMSTIN